MQLLGILAFVFALLFSVMVHEAGHYLTAKRFGMKVTEFFVGFGRRIWSTQRGETEFGVKAIPAGGYCKIVGMTPDENLTLEEKPRAFIAGTIPQRLIVLGAGSFLHFVLGFLLIFTLIAGIGISQTSSKIQTVSECIPQSATESCGPTSKASPAKTIGLQPGDRIIGINGEKTSDWNKLRDQLRAAPNQSVTLIIDRNGQQLDLPVVLSARELDGKQIGVLGVTNAIERKRVNPIVAVWRSTTISWEFFKASISALVSLPSKVPQLVNATFGNEERDPNGLVGVVGAARIAGDAVGSTLSFADKLATFLLMIATLNIFVGIFNLLPLLPLDGGHMAIAIADGIRNRRAARKGLSKPAPLNVNRLMPLTMVVFAILLTLSVWLLAADLFNPVKINF